MNKELFKEGSIYDSRYDGLGMYYVCHGSELMRREGLWFGVDMYREYFTDDKKIFRKYKLERIINGN